MEVKRFAISIQWGKGMHHFLRTDYETQTNAEEAGSKYVYTHSKKHKAGNLPIVHLWEHNSSVKCEPK